MTPPSTTSTSGPIASGWRRHVLGAMALLLLAGAVVFWFCPPERPWAQELQSACTKIGPLLVVFWLAYEQLRRLPVWIWWAMPVLVWVLAFRARWLLVLVPLLIVLAILMPRRPARQ
jgi:hypothetical protein